MKKEISKIFCILGPTNIGKSFISMELSNFFPLEIISVDSGLIYRYMNIGTDKPSKEQLNKVPHKLIDILDPKECYSVSNFFLDVKREVNLILNINRNIPLLVGGNMMYYNVLFNGLFELPESNNKMRIYIKMINNFYGSRYLYNILNEIDFNYAKLLHYSDTYRIMRALEVFGISGKKISILKRSKKKLNFNIIKFVILPKNKNILINSINNRFIRMLKNGLEEEVYNLYTRGDLNINMPSIKCIGYKQMWLYFQNKISYLDMINSSIGSTICLMKKQFTWINKINNSYFIYLDSYKSCVNKIVNLIKKNLY